jgi:hypothetical protein
MISFLQAYWWLVAPGTLAVIALLGAAYVLKDWKLVAVAGAVIGAVAAIGRAFAQGSAARTAQLERDNAAAKARRGELNRQAAAETDDDLRKDLGRYTP